MPKYDKKIEKMKEKKTSRDWDLEYEKILNKCISKVSEKFNGLVKNVERIDFQNLEKGEGFIQFLINNKKKFIHHILFEIELDNLDIIYLWYEKGTGKFMFLDVMDDIIKQIGDK